MRRETKSKLTELLPLKVYLLILTLNVPVLTAADDIHKYFFIIFQRK